jgi:uncharacterized damage-inducible protein DinB
MNLTEHYEQLRRYDVWANREVLRALKELPDPPARCVDWLSHVLAAEDVWLTRLQSQPSSLAVWPDLSLADCEQQIERLGEAWSGYFAAHLPQGLEETVSYKNSKGEAWSSKVRDVLTHVFIHSAHHRGQIASALRDAGHTPAYTDFIHGVRQGLFE